MPKITNQNAMTSLMCFFLIKNPLTVFTHHSYSGIVFVLVTIGRKSSIHQQAVIYIQLINCLSRNKPDTKPKKITNQNAMTPLISFLLKTPTNFSHTPQILRVGFHPRYDRQTGLHPPTRCDMQPSGSRVPICCSQSACRIGNTTSNWLYLLGQCCCSTSTALPKLRPHGRCFS